MKRTFTALLLSMAFGSACLFAACPTAPNTSNITNNVTRRVAQLTKILALDASQQAQATTIFTTAETTAATIQVQLCPLRETLQTDIRSGAGGAGSNASKIAADVNAIEPLEAQLLINNSTAENEFWLSLNSTQQTQVQNMRGGMGGFGPMGGFPPGGPGPRGGGGNFRRGQ